MRFIGILTMLALRAYAGSISSNVLISCSVTDLSTQNIVVSQTYTTLVNGSICSLGSSFSPPNGAFVEIGDSVALFSANGFLSGATNFFPGYIAALSVDVETTFSSSVVVTGGTGQGTLLITGVGASECDEGLCANQEEVQFGSIEAIPSGLQSIFFFSLPFTFGVPIPTTSTVEQRADLEDGVAGTGRKRPTQDHCRTGR